MGTRVRLIIMFNDLSQLAHTVYAENVALEMKAIVQVYKASDAVIVGFVTFSDKGIVTVYDRTGKVANCEPNVTDVFNAGVTQARYRYHYKAALDKIAATCGNCDPTGGDRAVSFAREALDSEPGFPRED